MAKIKAFRGIRPKRGMEQQIATPPYDVVSVEEARRMASGNRYSFFHISRPEIDLPDGIDVYSDEVYHQGLKNFKWFLNEGILLNDEKPSLYIYKIEMKERIQIGLTAGFSIAEYDAGLIRKHELTRPDKEKDRIKHILTINANSEPVLLAYREMVELTTFYENETVKEPDLKVFAQDGSIHMLWVVNDEEKIKFLEKCFEKIDFLYIADGHHRVAAASKVAHMKRNNINQIFNKSNEASFEYFLAVAFPHSQLKILDYNRLITPPENFSQKSFLEALKEKFTVNPGSCSKPQKPGTYKIFLPDGWYQLEIKSQLTKSNDLLDSLDVSILQNPILEPLLGIKNPRTDPRIEFVGGVVSPPEIEKRCMEENKIAFLVYPISIENLMELADGGLLAPPKTTWFEPKLRSGLVIRPL